MNLLSILLFSPVVLALMVYIIGAITKNNQLIKYTAFGLSLIPLAICLYMLNGFSFTMEEYQYFSTTPWIKTFGITYTIGLDGLSMPLVLLTALLTPLTIMLSFDEEKNLKTFMALILLLETGLMGVFVSLDYFLFYLFWEVVLIPMYFMILEWGGPRRRYAAIKFFIYTHVASLLMLCAIIAMYFVAGPQIGFYSFSMVTIANWSEVPTYLQYILFPALFFGFAVKIPTVPFHTWLPDAHVEAPTGGSVILAGVMLKMGGYGLVRIAFAMMPEAVQLYAIPMAIMGVISMIYGAFLALAQDDLKKMIAYSSVSHMGLVLFGLAVLQERAFNGAVFQMFAHGLVAAMLFMVCGILQHSVGTRKISELSGVATVLPHLGAFTVFAFFASLGLPGLIGFIPELSVFLGAFETQPILTVIAMSSMIMTAAYYIWALERAYFGTPSSNLQNEHHKPHDVVWFQVIPLSVLAILILVLGCYPAPIMEMIETSSLSFFAEIGGGL